MENNTSAAILLVVLVVSAFLVAFFKCSHSKLLRRPKHSDQQNCGKSNTEVFHVLAPSAFGICICAVCLCGSSWAWFTAATSTDVTTIQTATYTASVSALQGETRLTATTAKGGATEFALEAGKDYIVTIAPTGTATSGYCRIHFEDKDYYTEQLISGSLSFTVHVSKNSTLSVAPQWGTCAVANSGNTVGNNAELGTPQANSTAAANDAPAADAAPAPAASAEADSAAGSEPNSASANPPQAAAPQEVANDASDNPEAAPNPGASSINTVSAVESSAEKTRG